MNGHPANPNANAQIELNQAGYRYVVWHKVIPGISPSMRKNATPHEVIEAIFGARPAPIIEDELVEVYEIASSMGVGNMTNAIKLASNWRGSVSGGRWATSPATLEVDSPRPQNAVLQITPAYTYNPQSKNGIGTKGVLIIRVGHSAPISVGIEADRTTAVPVQLAAGSQTITLSLLAGNFQPAKYGWPDPGTLSFGIHSINLQTSAP